jgi:hypothetical protein
MRHIPSSFISRSFRAKDQEQQAFGFISAQFLANSIGQVALSLGTSIAHPASPDSHRQGHTIGGYSDVCFPKDRPGWDCVLPAKTKHRGVMPGSWA